MPEGVDEFWERRISIQIYTPFVSRDERYATFVDLAIANSQVASFNGWWIQFHQLGVLNPCGVAH